MQPRVYFGAVIEKNSVIGKQRKIAFASGITKATDTPQPLVMISWQWQLIFIARALQLPEPPVRLPSD